MSSTSPGRTARQIWRVKSPADDTLMSLLHCVLCGTIEAVHVYALLRREIPDQNQGSVHILPRYQSQLIFIELKYILKPFTDLEGGYGGCNPPFQISEIKVSNIDGTKQKRQSKK